MVRFKRPPKRRLSDAEIQQIARQLREQYCLKIFILYEIRQQQRTRLMKRVVDTHEQRIIRRIDIVCKEIFRFVRTKPEEGGKIGVKLSIKFQHNCIEYNRWFPRHEFYNIIGRVQDEYYKSTNALVQHIFSRAQTEWWDSAGWCGIFAILRIAWYFDPGEIKVLYKSKEDLESLKILWQQDIVFNAHDLKIWPGIATNMFSKVLNGVYGLECQQICLNSNFANLQCEICLNGKVRNDKCCPLKKESGFKQLTDYPQFYGTVGVGWISCESTEDGIKHAVFFKTKGTQGDIFFEDTGGSNQEHDFWEHIKEYSVLGVFLVSMPLNEKRLPRN